MSQQPEPDFEYIGRLLASKPKTVIISHHNPDGDAIGSVLAMKGYLAAKGMDAIAISPNGFPDFLKWLPSSNSIVVAEQKEQQAKAALRDAELIFCLDFNNAKRVEALEQSLASASAVKALIDHHPQPDHFANWIMSDVTASSTGELIYDFISRLGDAALIDEDIATNLFAAIVTDTGSFQHDYTSAKAHLIAADLMNRGVDSKKTFDRIYNSFSQNRVRFFGHCAVNKMKLDQHYGAAWMSVSKDDMKKFGINRGDMEGLVNLPLQIEGITFSVLFAERDKEIKVSLRSKGVLDVNLVARQYFNGGGHKNAAGGSLDGTLDEAERTFEKLLPAMFEQTGKTKTAA